MGDQTVDYLRRFWNSGMPTTVSGDHVYVESGTHVVSIWGSGQGISGQRVTISGDHVYVESGVWIAGLSFSGLDIQVNISGDPVIISGQPVTISGDHVYVESGARVVTTFASGQGASGAHVYLESGGFVTTQPGIQVSGTVAISGTISVDISGTPVTVSGDHVFVESGAFVTTQPGIQVSGTVAISGTITVDISGTPVTISGDHVYVESGAFVTTQPDIGVSGTVRSLISGDHVFVESGAYVIIESGIGVQTNPDNMSGQRIQVGAATTIRTGKLFPVEGGRSGGTTDGSGGISLCSGDFCSGPIHTIIIKNIADNADMYIGEVNCKPYSGYGFLLAATEAINLDFDVICDIYAYACLSGEFLTWIATDY